MDKILIIDDDKSIAEHVKLTLEKLGYEVFYTLHPNYIEKILESQNINLILLDMYMPKKDGLEVLKEIRLKSKYDYLPILMLTSDENESLLEKCLDKGAWDFLNKPVNPIILDARIKSALKLSRSLEQNEKFVSIVAHDLRNPIGAIQGLAELCLEEDNEIIETKLC